MPIALLSISCPSHRVVLMAAPPIQVRNNFSLEFGGVGQPTQIDTQLMPWKSASGRPCVAKALAKAKGHHRKATKGETSIEIPAELARYPELFITED